MKTFSFIIIIVALISFAVSAISLAVIDKNSYLKEMAAQGKMYCYIPKGPNLYLTLDDCLRYRESFILLRD